MSPIDPFLKGFIVQKSDPGTSFLEGEHGKKSRIQRSVRRAASGLKRKWGIATKALSS